MPLDRQGLLADPRFQALGPQERFDYLRSVDPLFGKAIEADPKAARAFSDSLGGPGGEAPAAPVDPLLSPEAPQGIPYRAPPGLGAPFDAAAGLERVQTNVLAPVARGIATGVRAARGVVEALRAPPLPSPEPPQPNVTGFPGALEEAGYFWTQAQRALATGLGAAGVSGSSTLEAISGGLERGAQALEGYAEAHPAERPAAIEEESQAAEERRIARPPVGAESSALALRLQFSRPGTPEHRRLLVEQAEAQERDRLRAATQGLESNIALRREFGAPLRPATTRPTEGAMGPFVGPLIRGGFQAGAELAALLPAAEGLGAIGGALGRLATLPAWSAAVAGGSGEDPIRGAAQGGYAAAAFGLISQSPNPYLRTLAGAMLATPELMAAVKGEVPWDQAAADAVIWGAFGYSTPFDQVKLRYSPQEIARGEHLPPELRAQRALALRAMDSLRPGLRPDARPDTLGALGEASAALQGRGGYAVAGQPEPGAEAGRPTPAQLRGVLGERDFLAPNAPIGGFPVDHPEVAAPPKPTETPEAVPRGTAPTADAEPPSPSIEVDGLPTPPAPGQAPEPFDVAPTPGQGEGPPPRMTRAALKRALIAVRDKPPVGGGPTPLTGAHTGIEIRHTVAFPRAYWDISWTGARDKARDRAGEYDGRAYNVAEALRHIDRILELAKPELRQTPIPPEPKKPPYRTPPIGTAIPGGRFPHFTSSESAAALKGGAEFDFTQPPQHPLMEGYSGEQAAGPGWAGRAIYLSLDDPRWGEVKKPVEGAGPPVEASTLSEEVLRHPDTKTYYDYKLQKWMAIPNGLKRERLEPVYFRIDPMARHWMIHDPAALRSAELDTGVQYEKDSKNPDFWKAMAARYDVVEIRNTKQHGSDGPQGEGGWKHYFWDEAGGDQVVVLNPAMARVEADQATTYLDTPEVARARAFEEKARRELANAPVQPIERDMSRAPEAPQREPRTQTELEEDRDRVEQGEHPNSLDNGPVAQFSAGQAYRGQLDFPLVHPGARVPTRRQIDYARILKRLVRTLRVPVTEGQIRYMWNAGTGSFDKISPDTLGWTVYSPTRGGRFGKSGAWIHMQHWADLQTAAHEFGHNLALQFPEIGKLFFKSAADVKTLLSKPQSAWTPQEIAWKEAYELTYTMDPALFQSEGQAEFLRHWLTDSSYLDQKAPTMHALFNELLDQNLGVAKGTIFGRYAPVKGYAEKVVQALRRTQKDMHRYYKTGAVEQINNFYRAPSADLSDAFSTPWDKMREVIADEAAGAWVFEREVHGGIQPDSVYELMRNARSVPDQMHAFFVNGAPDWVPVRGRSLGDITFRKDLPTPQEVFTSVGRSTQEAQAFLNYVDARQAKEILEAGKPHPFTKNQIEAGIALGKGRPHFEKAYADLAKLSEAFADFGQKAGLWGPASRARWNRGPNYILPMLRHLELSEGGGRRGQDALVGARPIYEYRGSGRHLKDPFVRILDGWSRIVQMAMENRVRLEIERVLNEPGGIAFGRRVPAGIEKFSVSPKEIERKLRKALKDKGVIVPKDFITGLADLERINFYMGGKLPNVPHAMRVFHGDTVHYYNLHEPMLARALASLYHEPIGGWLRAFSYPKKIYHAAVTSSIDFFFRNAVRDPFVASMTTKTGTQHFTAAARGYVSAARKDARYWEMMANGGGGDAFGSGVRSPQQVQKYLVKVAQREGWDPRGFLFTPADIWHAWRNLGAAIEQGPRMGEYLRAREQGASATHAAFLKSEITTDFRMRGTDQGVGRAMRMLAETTPFFNPMWVSADKTIRNMMMDPTHKALSGMRLGLWSLFGLALHLWNRGHPAYDRMEDWDKDSFLHFIHWGSGGGDPLQDKIYRMPTMWEFGLVSNISRRWYEELAQSPDEDHQGIAKGLAFYLTHLFHAGVDTGWLLMHNFEMGLPGGVLGQTAYAGLTGRDFYTDRPISPDSLAGKAPFMRASVRQGRAMREVGLFLGKVSDRLKSATGYGVGNAASPAWIEAVARYLFSSWAGYGVALAERFSGGPAKFTDDLPVISNFVERPMEYSKTPNLFYSAMRDINEAYESMQALRKDVENPAGTPMKGASADDPYRLEHWRRAQEYNAQGAGEFMRVVGPIDQKVQEIESRIRALQLRNTDSLGPQREALSKEIWSAQLEKLATMEAGVAAAIDVQRRVLKRNPGVTPIVTIGVEGEHASAQDLTRQLTATSSAFRQQAAKRLAEPVKGAP